MERKYMMYEGEDGNSIDFLYESPTEQRNGVKIIIPINSYDRSNFIRKIQEQLAYFEDVYFNVPNINNDEIRITRNEHFQHSTMSSDQYMHICLDNVYYPLDYSKLELQRNINLPIGLRFSLSDGIFPTPNREAIRYTKEAKEAILNKITKVANYLVEKYNDNITESDDIINTLPKFGTSDHALNFELGKWYIDDIALHSNILFKSPSIKGIEISDLKRVWQVIDYILPRYYVVSTKFVRNGRFKTATKWDKKINWNQLILHTHYKFEDKLDNSIKRYFRENMTHKKDVFFVKKHPIGIPLGKLTDYSSGYDNYIKILELKKYPKKEWRKRIQECQYLVSKVLDEKVLDIKDFKIPDEWFEKKKKIKLVELANRKARKVKLSGELSAKKLIPLEKYVGADRYAKQTPIVIDMAKAHLRKYLSIYGSTEDASMLERWFSIANKNQENLEFLVFSEREIKKMDKINLHNFMKLEDFTKGKSRPFKRMVTAELIYRFISKHRRIFDSSEIIEENISKDLATKMNILKEYVDKYHRNNGGDGSLYEIILPFAEENKLFDPIIYPIYKELNVKFTKLPFLSVMFDGFFRYWNKDQCQGYLKCIRELFKYHKYRIDWQHYVKVIENNEVLQEN